MSDLDLIARRDALQAQVAEATAALQASEDRRCAAEARLAEIEASLAETLSATAGIENAKQRLAVATAEMATLEAANAILRAKDQELDVKADARAAEILARMGQPMPTAPEETKPKGQSRLISAISARFS